MFSSQATNSPSKVSVPSRKQRNQPSGRVHDIEFATEISTSLLGQVRQLQALLSEREQTLKDVTLDKSRLELEAEGFTQRLRALDESEQRYKDENWSLETQNHELDAAAKESSAREDRLTSTINALSSEKNQMQRELDDVKQTNDRLMEDNTAAQKSHDSEIHLLRRNISLGDGERTSLQQKIDELTSQNQELAKAVTANPRQRELGPAWDVQQEEDDDSADDKTPENSPPPSPNKQTPRHNHLESETLKSSLHHAHRMIQNLKNNIHREKTEKLELKRMLQDARDEVEQRRTDPSAAAPSKRQKAKADNFKKPPRPEKLGVDRKEVTRVDVDEPDWEDQTGDASPTREQPSRSGRSGMESASDAYQTANEADDDFETANEREITTESEGFQTGAESLAESSDELTETEDRPHRVGPVRSMKRPSALATAKAGDRGSFASTASTSADEADYAAVHTPVQTQPARYRLKMNRSSRNNNSFDAASESPRYSPAGFSSPPQRTASGGQSLFAELGEAASEGESDFGTPGPDSQVTSPTTQRGFDSSQAFNSAPPIRQVLMVDSATMTDPWEPAVPSAASSQGTPVAGGQEQTAVVPTTEEDRDVDTEFVDSGTQYTPTKSPSPAKNGPVAVLDTPPKMAWDKVDDNKDRPDTADSDSQHRAPPVPSEPLELQLSSIFSELTSPVSPQSPARAAESQPELTTSAVQSLTTEPVAARPYAPTSATSTQLLELSTLHTQDTRPVTSVVTRPSQTPIHIDPLRSNPTRGDASKPAVNTVSAETQTDKRVQPSDEVSRGSAVNAANALSSRQSTEGVAQTILTGSQIDQLLAARPPSSSHKQYPRAVVDPADSPSATPKAKQVSSVPTMRPGSAGSQRSQSVSHPPLPADHKQTIAAATQKASSESKPGTMGPPLAPASAYRTNASNRPHTPSEKGVPRNGAETRTQNRHPSRMSQRSSVSSFASELDDRFNMERPEYAFEQGTDPRMIQAITQTMIGEFLWKYTRKAGRPEMSNTRHLRYFWVHPYTRTLYWSAHDPQAAGKKQQKAKSVPIEAVRMVTDDNPYPPGLHRKSLEIVTPARVVKFTAGTSQRHETWFNALSYLLLRADDEAGAQEAHDDNAGEFDPYRRADSRTSVASRNNRAAHTLSKTYVQDTVRARQTTTPSLKSPSQSSSRQDSRPREQGSLSRLSNLFRASPVRGTLTGRRSRQAGLRESMDSESEASHDSAEDLRRVMQKQEQGADRVENVRACCDGKFFLVTFIF